MNADAKFIADAVAEAGPALAKDKQTMLEGLDTFIAVLQRIKDKVTDDTAGPLSGAYKQVRDIRPQYIRSEQGEHTALHQVGPVVTQITVLDYANVDKMLDT